MSRKVLIIVSLPFLLVVAVCLFATSDYADDYLAKRCGPAYWENRIATKKDDPKVQSAFEKVKDKRFIRILKRIDIPVSEGEDILHDSVIYAEIAERKRCEIPAEFERQFMDKIIRPEKEGVRVCSDDAYRAEAEETYSNAFLKVFPLKIVSANTHTEASIYAQFMKLSDFFKKKWEDSSYRKQFMISAYQARAREKNGCKDPLLPIKKEMVALMKEKRAEQE